METVSVGSAYLGHLVIFSIRVTPAYSRLPCTARHPALAFLPPFVLRFKAEKRLFVAGPCVGDHEGDGFPPKKNGERSNRRVSFNLPRIRSTPLDSARGWKLLDNWDPLRRANYLLKAATCHEFQLYTLREFYWQLKASLPFDPKLTSLIDETSKTQLLPQLLCSRHGSPSLYTLRMQMSRRG